jgi:hypothetical protein
MSINLTPPPVRLVQGCFDESGKLADSEFVAFGGCVAPENAFEAFLPKWRERLHADKLSYTSMKDAIHFRGPFEDWGRDIKRRDTLLFDLAQLLSDAPIMRVASPMTTAEFRALPETQRKRFGNDIVYCGFEACIQGMLNQGTNLALHIACDLSEEYAKKCLTLFNKLRARNEVIKSRCFAITFADDTQHLGLQAADMVAFCARAEKLAPTKPQESIIERIIDLFRSQRTEVGTFLYRADGPGLGYGELEM